MVSWLGDRARLDVLLLAATSALLQIVYLHILPIAIEGDGAGYFLAARYLMGDPQGIFSTFHPPGYPLFLLATGALWLPSLYLTITVQAVMGAVAPLLVFGILRDANRGAALAAALVFALSGVPYSYAKAFLSEQVYMFLVLVMALGVAVFINRQRARYAVLALASGAAAILVRNEALYLTLLAFAVMAVVAWPSRRRLWILAVSGGLAASAILAWSGARAVFMNDYALIGSLNNYYGHTLFYRVYVTLPPEVRFWHCVVAEPRDPTCLKGSIPFTPLVDPENGPASRDLAKLISDWASSDSRKQFPRQTSQQIYRDFFAKPTEGGAFDRFGLANWLTVSRLGHLKSDELLRQVAFEAIRAHPEALYMIVASAGSYFGVSFQNVAYYYGNSGSSGPLVFANWQEDGYETQPYNAALAQAALLPELQREYRESWQIPATEREWKLLSVGRLAHNLVRNIVGLVFLVIWPALWWARDRTLALFLLASFALMLATYAVSAGYSMRFEHVLLPFMLMATSLALATLALAVRARLKPRRSGPIGATAGKLRHPG